MKYTRVYADENGESHFEDVEVEFSPVDFAPPAPPLDLSAFAPATQSEMSIAQGVSDHRVSDLLLLKWVCLVIF